MQLRILVFDQDKSLRELLGRYLTLLGHDVHEFKAPSACPLYNNLGNENCSCSKETPCGDVVIMDMRMPQITGFDFLQWQRRRGCKAIDANKAIMSTSVNQQIEEAMAIFGCHHIVKPFRLLEIKSWVEECASRTLNSSKQQS